MPRTATTPLPRLPGATLPVLLAAAACLAIAPRAQAQVPLAEASVQALINALDGGPRTRSFMRTALPDASTHLCGGARRPAAQGGTRAPGDDAPAKRTLVVEAAVPYAGDTTAGVNLDIGFDNSSDKPGPRDLALLDNLARALKDARLAGSRFAVAGHADSSGTASINLELSCARALAVVGHLRQRGIAADRMAAYGFGSTRLLVAEEPESGRNRRVEIRMAP